jgi:hypothetical protein
VRKVTSLDNAVPMAHPSNRWWEREIRRRPRRATAVAALWLGLGTFLGVEEYGRSTLGALGVAAVMLVVLVLFLRFGSRE